MLRIVLVISFVAIPICVFGHGMNMKPVNRASRWRFNHSAPANYEDNELFCGGFGVQWNQNGGKCGQCGDNYADPTPRKHELGGPFGEGVIVEKYKPGDVIPAEVLITANHLGYFKFTLCNIDESKTESEDCFQPLYIANGDEKFVIDEKPGYFYPNVQIPPQVKCEHCVFRWTYTTGNTWGQCENGDFDKGCGPQETFRTCSDISILP